jgi:error-prone DNA polymerase
MNYADLQVTTHFSFLRGASSPEELFSAAALLGIKALGIVDRNSLAGMVRAHEAAKTTGVRLVVGYPAVRRVTRLESSQQRSFHNVRFGSKD